MMILVCGRHRDDRNQFAYEDASPEDNNGDSDDSDVVAMTPLFEEFAMFQ